MADSGLRRDYPCQGIPAFLESPSDKRVHRSYTIERGPLSLSL